MRKIVSGNAILNKNIHNISLIVLIMSKTLTDKLIHFDHILLSINTAFVIIYTHFRRLFEIGQMSP